METLKYYWYYVDARFVEFPLVIRITLVLTGILLAMYLLSAVKIMLLGLSYARHKRREARVIKKYDAIIEDILFSSEQLSPEEIEERLAFKVSRKRPWKQEHISSMLFQFTNGPRASELNNHNYINVLKSFSLPEFWEKQLRKSNLEKNANALRAFEDMGETVKSNVVSLRVNARNNEVRKHARSVSIKMKTHNAFQFLENDFDKTFNAFDALRIHSSLKELAVDNKLPLLIRWVKTAKNDTYKAFLIQEIGIFKQVESAPHILELFDFANSVAVNVQIVETLTLLEYTEAASYLIEQYDFCPHEVQDKIIDLVGTLYSQKGVGFLENCFYKATDKEMIVKILKYMYINDKDRSAYYRVKASFSTHFEHKAFEYIEGLVY